MRRRQDDKQPPTVGFNLKDMRDAATHTLLDSMRQWAREMDKIDTLEEMFNKQHQATAAAVNTRAGTPATRSNGHSVPAAEPERQPHTSARPSLAEMVAFRDTVQAELDAHPTDGRTVTQIMETLKTRGQLPQTASRTHTIEDIALGKIRYLLNQLVNKKLAHSETMRSKYNNLPVYVFYPTPPAKPKKQFSKAGLKALRANIAKAQAVRHKGEPKVKPGSMRDLVLSSLATLGEASPMGISTYLTEKQNVPPKRGNNSLNNHVNWTLRSLLKQKRVTRQEREGEHPTYRLP